MKLQERNLSIEMQGEEVNLLHSKPKLIHPFIIEVNDRFFGETIRKSCIKSRKVSVNFVETFEGRESFTTPIRIQGESIE